jgi:hypothetical protein
MARETKSDNLLATLFAILRVCLLLTGIIGLSISIFRDDGWLTQLLARMFSSTMGMVSIFLLILVAYMLNRWLTAPTGKASSRGDFPLKIMMAIGAFFLYRLITTGHF